MSSLVCAVCGENAPHSCSACRQLAYCSKEHQKQHWPQHKKNCAQKKKQQKPAILSAATSIGWVGSLSLNEQYSTLAKSYLVRCDDEHVLKISARGLYDDERDAANMVVDFVVFCKLALRRGLLPKNWNWKHFLAVAVRLVVMPYDASDVAEECGMQEDAFVRLEVLRRMARAAYGEDEAFVMPSQEETNVATIKDGVLMLPNGTQVQFGEPPQEEGEGEGDRQERKSESEEEATKEKGVEAEEEEQQDEKVAQASQALASSLAPPGGPNKINSDRAAVIRSMEQWPSEASTEEVGGLQLWEVFEAQVGALLAIVEKAAASQC